jgi:hypothetical protein
VNTNLTCDEESRRENAERYATRKMTAEEAVAFEDHFVTCAECQNEVRLASAIAAEVSQAPVATRPVPRARRVWIWGTGGLAFAAGLATLMVMQSKPRSDLVALGAVREPPVYLGIQVRGVAAEDSLFEAAMDAYATRRYSAAIAGLRAVLAAGRDSVPAHFFIATSQLLDNRPAEAAAEYERVLAHGDTPYRAEARYYRAKALLRLRRATDAVGELAELAPADGIAYEMGKALADSVTRVRDR